VRAKVNSLRAKTATNDSDKEKALSAADTYLRLMHDYIKSWGKAQFFPFSHLSTRKTKGRHWSRCWPGCGKPNRPS